MVRFYLTQRALVLEMQSSNSKYFCRTYSSFFDCPEETVLTVCDKYKAIFLYPEYIQF